MANKEDLTYESFQKSFDLNIENVMLQRKFASETDEEKKMEIQNRIEENQQIISENLPTSRVGVCSCKAFISNTLDSLKVALFVEEHPAAAERINVFLPENLTKEEIDVRSEALKNMAEQVSNVTQAIEIGEVSSVSAVTSSEGAFCVVDK